MSNVGVSLEKLRALQITPLEDEEDDEPQGNGVGDIIDDDDDEEEEEQVPVTLGFVEKPKNRWSLLRQLFPSKAGGVPVMTFPIRTLFFLVKLDLEPFFDSFKIIKSFRNLFLQWFFIKSFNTISNLAPHPPTQIK